MVILSSCFQSCNYFHPSGVFQELFFRLYYPEAFISEYFVVLSFQIRSPIILYSCLFVRLHILPVLRSSMLQSARGLFFQLHLDSLKYIRASLILPGDSVSFISHFRILTVVLSRFFFFDLSYWFIRSFQSYRWFMKTFSSLRYVTSQSFSRRISNMQNPLLVINLIWWRISIQ